jgi:GNAT superfamily N-acetyltransferase
MIRVTKCDPEVVRVMVGEVLCDESGETTWEEGAEYWAAYDGTDLIGFAGLKQSERWTDCVYFHTCGIVWGYRGKRLQRRLIRARLRWAKRNGFVWAHTYTLPSNPASSRSLIACGFRPYWPARPWAGAVCYWFRKL